MIYFEVNHFNLIHISLLSLSLLSRFEEADEVLLLGVHRKAQPLERLIRKQLEFRQRQKNREKSLLIDSPMSNAAVFSNDLSSAQVLRTLSSSNPQLQSSSQSIKPPSVAASSSSKSFKVHKDENSTGMSVRPSVQELLPNNEGRSSEGAELFWKDYGSDAGRQKENIKEATGWIGQKLHQKSKLIPQKNFDKFEVFKDGQADEVFEEYLSC